MEKVYTMQDWQRDGVFNASIGQEVEDAVYYEFLNCVPPAYLSNFLFQVGEPASHDRETGKPLYTTFAVDACGNWEYKGICLLGKQENRKGWGD